MTVAFVFQGGAGLAAVQVGMVRALTDAGIRPDIVVGSSAGALNAVAFAQDPTERGLDALQRLWVGVRRSDVFPVSLRSLAAGLTGRGDSLVASDGLRSLVERGLRVRDLRDTVIPVHVVATDALTGSTVVLSDGPAAQALLASAAIPGILSPVERDGRLLIDGSVSADIPILQAEALGATTSYVLPSLVPVSPAGAPSGALPILLRTMGMLLDRTATRDLAAARGDVHLLPAPSLSGVTPLDFRHGVELMRLGRETALGWLAERAGAAA
ncbi:patatin-like phospholipase family protein [Streptomyces phaeochromogenes]|uniref:patatin-like phospholipase family protein n=1 Tax=Streptomyces phaeochromogenes TaxID=1923 RepID=UPI002DD9A1A0|nr:patatin-like phospholipase family protein [Streptomyces phaeochromogenes]WRZ34474.1 patatin-like phospholipase family protein [Streptomyces phaeochromogenes]